MSHTKDFAVGVGRSAHVAIAAIDGHIALLRLRLVRFQCLQHGRMALGAVLAVHAEFVVALKRPHRKIRGVAELAVRAPLAQIVAQLEEVLLELLHIRAIRAVLQ